MSRTLVCWVSVLSGYVLLVMWGASRPIQMLPADEGWLGWMATAMAGDDAVSRRRPPPPPPPLMSREQAEGVIRSSTCADAAQGLCPRLERSIRVSAVPVASADEIAHGASRFAAPPDVPAGFRWPEFDGIPMTLLAQIDLREVAEFDQEARLPASGWLCFFYAMALDPPALGRTPEDKVGWHVELVDGSPESLQRIDLPEITHGDFPMCAARFWSEWTLPNLLEEPEFLRDHPCLPQYPNLRAALAGNSEELGWHHLLGTTSNLTGPLRPVCELASGGTAVTDKTDFDDPKLKPRLSGARDWVLLFQVQLDGLQAAEDAYLVPPDSEVPAGAGQPAYMSSGPTFHSEDRLFFFIRQQDLRDEDFGRVWAVRQRFGDQDEVP